ncbi:MAG: hypothetical protein HeimC2_32210 [Candidatus Heimdallarchaeota archaeon LC_2]|nr:MAG: hypothetical protein HeimC2_32210 [Candidatus Heimdallarchaeota archaeon LC_2]
MTVRRQSSYKKMFSRGKRAVKKTSLRAVDVGVLPLKVSGQLIKFTGEKIKGRFKGTVWRGRATRIVGGSIERVGKTMSFPIIVWEDHARNERERLNIESRMQKIGWGEITNIQSIPENSVAFIPNREEHTSQDEAIEEVLYDY